MTQDERRRLEDMLDLHGAEFSRWPEPAEAQRARAAALGDPVFRRRVDAARRLDTALGEMVDSIDQKVAAPALASLESTVLKEIGPQAERRRMFSTSNLRRLAAGALIAVAVGAGIGEWGRPAAQPEVEAFDQLLLGSDDVAAQTAVRS